MLTFIYEAKNAKTGEKVKANVQGDTVRVTSNNKDELQAVIQLIRAQDFDFPVSFANYR